jgi:hypothetical protein
MRIELPSNKIETIGLYVYSSFEGLDFEKDRKLIEAVFKRIEGKFSKKEMETLIECGYTIDGDRRKAWKQSNSYRPYR